MKRVILLLVFFSVKMLLFSQTASEPIIRLNTEMHNAVTGCIDIDASGKYILTASYDKTAKLWDATNGNLLRTFRIPIGLSNEGMLYACAISPDGLYSAVGGWTGYSWEESHSIYLFKTHTGELYARFKGLPNIVNDLEFSRDGKYLAASLGLDNGVYIFETPTSISKYMELIGLAPYKILTGYEKDCYNITFSNDGRLASVCEDGMIRLYNKDFKLVHWKIGSGRKPFSISFSPDGNKLAVGYEDSPIVDVFSGRTLDLMYQPDLDGVSAEGGMCVLVFSADGENLFGGGYLVKYINQDWWYIVRRWSDAGQGDYIDYAATQNSIMDLKAHPDGGLIYLGGQPDFGRITSWGGNLFYKEAEINSFLNEQFRYLSINDKGDEIGYKPYLADPVSFSVSDRALQVQQSYFPIFSDNQAGIIITDWEDSDFPLINGLNVNFIDEYEECRCVDISPDGRRIIFGTDWAVYCSDDEGNLIWETPVQDVTWAVNISGNGKVVVTTIGSGIINWYRMSDGELLLTLFAHPDNRRWVLFTPTGYYDASPGAEDLIGWHLNNGQDKEAYFYPASKFRQKYYRPEVIDNILKFYDVDEAVATANWGGSEFILSSLLIESLPPIVNILSPDEGDGFSSNTVQLGFSAKSPGGEGITAVKVLIDGRPSGNNKGFKPIRNENTARIGVDVPPRDVKISLMAENKHGWSVPAEVNIKWKGAVQRAEDILKPTLYILAVGVSDYQIDDYDLNYAAKDAEDFVVAMKTQKGGLYKDVNTKVLTDASATKNNILDGLEWLQKETTSRDMAMLFISGHGINDNIGTFYYLPYEADIESIRRTCLMFTEVKYTVSAIPGKIIVFADACHSGNLMGSKRRAPDINNLVNELSDAESGAVVFTSSTGKQYSLENETWANGAFTKALIEGINGEADLFGKGIITIKSLDAFIAERVKTLTDGQQSPTTVIPQSIPDFPIGVVVR